jgi:hypothetical protein
MLTRIPCPRSSWANVRMAVSIAALATVYAPLPRGVASVIALEIMMMSPRSARRRSGSNACTRAIGPRACTLRRSTCSVARVDEMSRPLLAVPALLTRRSMRPSVACTSSSMAVSATGSSTDARKAAAWPLAEVMEATASSAAAASRRKLMATLAPSAARRTAIDRPMPREPPVTRAVRPRRRCPCRTPHAPITACPRSPSASFAPP